MILEMKTKFGFTKIKIKNHSFLYPSLFYKTKTPLFLLCFYPNSRIIRANSYFDLIVTDQKKNFIVVF